MDKVFWLISGKLAGRAGPCVSPWDLEKIRASGISTILSTDDQCDSNQIKNAGLNHIAKYMPTAYPTNPALVDRFVDLVRDAAIAVLEELKQGSKVLVHCYAGRDRTGLVLCAVIMELENIGSHEALKRVRKVRPEALTGPGVLDVLTEYELRLKSGAFS